MTGREAGFLLLTSRLGVPERKVLTMHQLGELAGRVSAAGIPPEPDRELTLSDLRRLGYDEGFARRILELLNEQALLEYYIEKGRRAGCVPLPRINEFYPRVLRRRLGYDAPGCLWAKGDLSLLARPAVALVGSRDLAPPNGEFARRAGREAARQGYVLVSGNARGADRTAQEACLGAGGGVISVAADELTRQRVLPGVLYLSEDGFDAAFSTPRALRRNRIIHALGQVTLVAQSALYQGGTWSGTARNLRRGWSPVFCFDDGSEAALALAREGAALIGPEALADLSGLQNRPICFFDQ